MKTILNSNLKHKKLLFWIGLQGLGILFVLGWILCWVLAPQILWLDLLFMILSILQFIWTIFEWWNNKYAKNDINKKKFGFLIDKDKYSYTEIICNWSLWIFPIILIALYTPVIIFYYQPMMNWINHNTMIWPLPNWIMYIMTFILLIMISVCCVKFRQMHRRRSSKLVYKTINDLIKAKIKRGSTGTYDGTFDGVKKKSPKGFN